MSPAAEPSAAMRSRSTIRLSLRSAMNPTMPRIDRMSWYFPKSLTDSWRTTMSVAAQPRAATT